jgi:16S rRNA (cytidine1402-2'-O)-methyltransferase
LSGDGQASPDRGGALYVVATPIGNPEDITARAVRVLHEADLIACEDTRRTSRMLAAHGICTPTISYFEHNEQRRAPELVQRLQGGESIALVTDAGTPTISDPGYRLVRAALEAGIRVAAVPGACAAIAALSVAGLATDRFTFEGFIPARPAARRKLLAELAGETRTMVFFETARRLRTTLEEMASSFGGDRHAAVVREITKTFEETLRGTLKELSEIVGAHEPRGEITLVVEGAGKTVPGLERAANGAISVEMLCEAGLSLKQASAVVAKLRKVGRREVYQQVLRERRMRESS